MLDGHCAAIERDPSTIEHSIQMIANYENLAETRDGIRPYIEAGATHLILNLRPPYPESIIYRLAEEIAEPLKTEFSSKAD